MGLGSVGLDQCLYSARSGLAHCTPGRWFFCGPLWRAFGEAIGGKWHYAGEQLLLLLLVALLHTTSLTSFNPSDTEHMTNSAHEADAIDDAQRALRSCTKARIGIGDRFELANIVLDPTTGTWITPIAFDAIGREDLTLYLPEDVPESPRVLIVATEIDGENHAGADRHGAYFPGSKGRFTRARWVSLTMLHAKIGREVFDASEVHLISPWQENLEGVAVAPGQGWRVESQLIRHLRQADVESKKLARACLMWAKVEVESPTLLGVDCWGLDVRATLGPMRVEFPKVARTAREVVALFGNL